MLTTELYDAYTLVFTVANTTFLAKHICTFALNSFHSFTFKVFFAEQTSVSTANSIEISPYFAYLPQLSFDVYYLHHPQEKVSFR